MMAGADQNPDDLDIEALLKRAAWSASAAHKGARPLNSPNDPGAVLNPEMRAIFAQTSLAWTALAAAKQTEREYEERKIKEITESVERPR